MSEKLREGKRNGGSRADPLLHQRSRALQRPTSLRASPLGLEDDVRERSIRMLNDVLQDSVMLRDMYKKHHWQVAGPTFYQLHLLFDKHYEEQAPLVDALAERIQILGGVALAMPHDVAESTRVARVPTDAEEPPVQISRLLEAHEVVLKEAHRFAKQAGDDGDDGTNDLLVSEIIRTNEMQVWFLSEHLVAVPLVQVGGAAEEEESVELAPPPAAPS